MKLAATVLLGALVGCVLAVVVVVFSGCASSPPMVVVVPQSGGAPPTKLQALEAKVVMDLKLLWPCIKKALADGIHPANPLADIQDVADMLPCLKQIHEANAALADAGRD